MIIAHVEHRVRAGNGGGETFSMDKERAHGPGVGDEKRALSMPSLP